MKINEIVTEAEVTPYQSHYADLAEAVELFNNECSESVALLDFPIWRGMRNHKPNFVVIDPSTGIRKSENTTNHYTEIIDNSPYMNGWPKRSKSLICSSEPDNPSGYGDLYAIFPFNGVKIAVCPGADMWQTPIDLSTEFADYNSWSDMAAFNDYLRRTLLLPSDYQQMVNKITYDEHWRTEVFPMHTAMSPDDFLPYLQKKLSPQVAGFQLLSIGKYANVQPRENECWIGGPVLAVRSDQLVSLAAALRGRNNENQ